MRKYILVKKTLVVLGVILVILGIVFVGQSKSSVGPQSSFMYSNSQWTVNGFAISIIGSVVLACGVIIHLIKNIKC
jgi:hypothetical protein